MSAIDIEKLHLPRRNVRLDTLVRLRWLSVIGQTAAVLFVYFGLNFDFPLWACLSAITLSAWLNVVLRMRFSHTRRLEPERAALLLGFDIVELGVLFFLTGGLENPFAFLFLGPVLLGATALPPRMTVWLGIVTVLCATTIGLFHYPLPWSPDNPIDLPDGYVFGVWLSLLLTMGFISIYAWQITEEARQLVNALAAAELALAREQHLTQIDGLAAAAAHALGTPLSTISVVARELERAMDPKSPHAEDVKLLREQAQRCRDILAKLNELPGEGEPFDRLPLSALLDEVAAPHRNFGIAIDVKLAENAGPQPSGARNPAILYGLGNLVENAVDFARARVDITAEWDKNELSIVITDDGPGFEPQIMSRIGEPYVRSRRRRRMYASEDTGLGLGFFIAKTLLERSGAKLSFVNRPHKQGAAVTVKWQRSDFERFPLSLHLEKTAGAA